jgi:hypothetical protein
MAMADHLGDAWVQRLRERAQDPARRSDEAALAAGSVSLEEALPGQQPDEAPQSEELQRQVSDYLGGINSPFAAMIDNSVTGDGSQARGLLGALSRLTGGKQLFAMTGAGVMSLGGAVESRPAPPPAPEAAVAAAERELGFALPPVLRQLYLEVADGGVGPGGGIFSLSELVAKHHEMTDEPVGPQGQAWPAALLPIQGDDWDLVSLDGATGRLVSWDLEELDDDDELPPDNPTWAASFVPEADGLETWLSEWAAG